MLIKNLIYLKELCRLPAGQDLVSEVYRDIFCLVFEKIRKKKVISLLIYSFGKKTQLRPKGNS